MFDTLTWFVDIMGTLTFMAGVFIALAAGFGVYLFAKRLPKRIQRFIKSFAKSMFVFSLIFTIFKELNIQNFYIFTLKTLLLTFILAGILDITRLLTGFIVTFGERLFRRSRLLREELPFDGRNVPYCANEKKQSSPFCVLKISSVSLQ